MLADKIDAQTTHPYGLVNFLVDSKEIAAETDKLSKRLACSATQSLAAIKKLMHASQTNIL